MSKCFKWYVEATLSDARNKIGIVTLTVCVDCSVYGVWKSLGLLNNCLLFFADALNALDVLMENNHSLMRVNFCHTLVIAVISQTPRLEVKFIF